MDKHSLFLGLPLPLSAFSTHEGLQEIEREGVSYVGKSISSHSTLEEIEFLQLHLFSLLKDKRSVEAVILPLCKTSQRV